MANNMEESLAGYFFSIMHEMHLLTEQEREKKWKICYETFCKFEDEYTVFLRQFADLKQTEIELEKKIGLLQQELDQIKSRITENDRQYHSNICANRYKRFWDFLDEKSKEFFITADYILRMMEIEGADYSPAVIEFCRIFENELRSKIYIDFINEMSSLERVDDVSGKYEKLKIAVEDNKSKGRYFLSAGDMITYLGLMRSTENYNFGYNYELKSFLEKRGSNINGLSERDFENKAISYINNFRNKAAHPELMNERSAEKCRERTGKLVKKFIFSYQNID